MKYFTYMKVYLATVLHDLQKEKNENDREITTPHKHAIVLEHIIRLSLKEILVTGDSKRGVLKHFSTRLQTQ